MSGCCGGDDCEIRAGNSGQARMLWIVFAINAGMFLVEFGAGWVASSTALLGDSLDMLGDALVYAVSLLAVSRGPGWKAGSATFKGLIMAGFGLLVLAEAVGKLIYGGAPLAGYMAGVGALALAANTFCLVLLTRFRDDDVNMRSAWICSRNDLIANTGVLVAAGFVVATGSLLPDVIVGVAIALLFLHSSVGVLRDAYHSRVEARTARTAG